MYKTKSCVKPFIERISAKECNAKLSLRKPFDLLNS